MLSELQHWMPSRAFVKDAISYIMGIKTGLMHVFGNELNLWKSTAIMFLLPCDRTSRKRLWSLKETALTF